MQHTEGVCGKIICSKLWLNLVVFNPFILCYKWVNYLLHCKVWYQLVLSQRLPSHRIKMTNSLKANTGYRLASKLHCWSNYNCWWSKHSSWFVHYLSLDFQAFFPPRVIFLWPLTHLKQAWTILLHDACHMRWKSQYVWCIILDHMYWLCHWGKAENATCTAVSGQWHTLPDLQIELQRGVH